MADDGPTTDGAPPVSRRAVVIGVIIAALIGSALTLGILRMHDEPAIASVPLDGTAPAPAIAGKNLMTGAPLSLGDYRGKPVVLNVWADWCDVCRREAPALREFAASNPDVAVLGVSTNNGSHSSAQRFNRDMGWTFPSIFDTGDRIAFDVLRLSALPATYYIDADGILRGKAPGEVTVTELKDVARRLKEPPASEHTVSTGHPGNRVQP